MVAASRVDERAWTGARSAWRAPRRRWTDGAIVVVWLTSLIVVALWVRGGGLQGLARGGGAGLTSLGRITGLVSANLLLYQVLLMARLPLFERGFGHDALTRAHRVTGFWSFWLFVAHVVTITAGYGATARTGVLAQTWQFATSYRGVLLAWVGTLMIVAAVVVPSFARIRHRVRYESWHLYHLYAYAGVFAALPHQLWTGADFVANPWARAYWWGLWGLAAASVLVWRIGVPLWRSARLGLRVEAVRREGARGVSVRMRGRGIERLHARAGQFFVWRFLGEPGWSAGHPFSLSAPPTPTRLQITARVVGDGTARLTRLRAGDRVLIEGPYGVMTGEERRGERLLMAGAGAGVAPLVALLQELPYARGGATLLVRDSSPSDVLLRREIADLAERRGVRVVGLYGHRARGGSPWLTDRERGVSGTRFLLRLQRDWSRWDAYVCGPPRWMDALLADLRRVGVPERAIHSERFAL